MPNEAIRAEIRARGVISFARFMELALYCPETGYYESNKDTVGRGGDFITSVSVGRLFGELLAFQFAEWLAEWPQTAGRLVIVEAGAHDAKLAADILNWLQRHRPKLFSELEYWILEPSANRQAWQSEQLKRFAPQVRWFHNLQSIATENQPSAGGTRQISGIFFSNELLDAFPVHRYGWDAPARQWFEWGVTLADEKFAWQKISDSLAPPNGARAGVSGLFESLPPVLLDLPPELLAVLPNGYIMETSPAAENWWRDAAKILAHGKLLAIDYGFTAAEMISPARVNGTLRAYHRHRLSADLLAHVGEQDLTAHVNFTALQNAGEAAGLKTENFSTQPQFLTQIFARAMKTDFAAGWDAPRTRQFQTLTHPEHLGRAFRVLVQGR